MSNKKMYVLSKLNLTNNTYTVVGTYASLIIAYDYMIKTYQELEKELSLSEDYKVIKKENSIGIKNEFILAYDQVPYFNKLEQQ